MEFLVSHLNWLGCCILFFWGGAVVLAAGSAIPADVQVVVHEKSHELADPDQRLVDLEQKIWWTAEGRSLKLVQAVNEPGLPIYSYFKDIEYTVVNPETGDTAFFAKHRFLQNKKVGLFVLSADGRLEVVFPYSRSEGPKKTGSYAAACADYMDTVTVPNTVKHPIKRKGKPVKSGSLRKAYQSGYRRLAWIPGTRNLMLIGQKHLWILDREQGEIREIKAKKYLCKPFNQDHYLNVVGGQRFEEPFFIWHRSGLLRVEWDGKLTKMFEARKGTAQSDVFGRSKVDLGDSLSTAAFEVFQRGAYFRIGKQVYNAEGEALYAFKPKQTRIEIALDQPTMAAVKQTRKILWLIDLESGEKRGQAKLKRKVSDVILSPDGTLVSVRYTAFYGTEEPEFAVFQLQEEGLIEVLAGKSLFTPILVRDHIFYLSDKQLFVQKIGEAAWSSAPFQGRPTDWFLKVNNEVVFSSLSPIDEEAILRRSAHLNPIFPN
ncbi:hypothetical protein [Acanthopleuribacter pedis]